MTADQLNGRGGLSQADLERIIEAVARFQEALDNGDNPDPKEFLHLVREEARAELHRRLRELLGGEGQGRRFTILGHSVSRRRFLFGGCLLLLPLGLGCYLFGPLVIRIATNKGEILIETNDLDIEVEVKDETGTIIERPTKRLIVLRAGDYDLDVTIKEPGRVSRFFTKHYRLERGGKEVLNVWLERPGARLLTSQTSSVDLLRREQIPPYELTVAGGGDANKARAGLVAIFGDSRLKHWGPVYSVAFSPDGKTVASASADRTVKLWHAATRDEERTLRGHTDAITSVTFDPDGKLLASAGYDGNLKLWDVATGNERATLQGMYAVVFSPDGKIMATGGNGVLRGVDADQKLPELKGEIGYILSVAFSPDGKQLATSDQDGTVKLWSMATRENYSTFKAVAGKDQAYVSVAFSPDGGTLATRGPEGTIRLWELASGNELRTIKASAPESMCFSPDAITLAEVSSGVCTLWDWTTGEKRRTLQRANRCVVFSANGKNLATGGSDGFVRLWDTANGEERLKGSGHTTEVSVLAVSRDGTTLATASHGGTVRIWDIATRNVRRTLRGNIAIRSISFNPDGKHLASGSDDGLVRLWDLATGEVLSTFDGHKEPVYSLAFSQNGQMMASSSSDRTVILRDMSNRQQPRMLKGHMANVRAVAISPDGGRLASASNDDTVKLWDTSTGREKHTLLGHAGDVTAVAFSPDGQSLVSVGDDNTLRLWDVGTGAARATLQVETHNPVFAAWSQDGKRLASCGKDGTVRLWNMSKSPSKWHDPQELTLGPSGGIIRQVVFTPEGRHLVTLNGNGTVYILRLSALNEEAGHAK